jgi:NSS family neurotransmitter:Na+ symporter
MGVAAGFLILSFYAVIAGWSLGYIYESISGGLLEYADPTKAASHFVDLTENVTWIVGYFAGFMVLTMFVVYSGVQKGIERGSKIMMPLLFLLLIFVMIRGITMEGSSEGIKFLLHPDWSHVNGQTILIALGQAFFTLSMGMGAMLTYGSYMSKKDSIPTSALQIVILDTSIALIAGIAIFTSVFAVGLDANAGPGLIFHTLPAVFTKMPGGDFIGPIFFILLSIAALTSAISLLEVITAYFVDEKGWSRHKAVTVFGTVTFLIGIPSALSFNVLADFKILGLNFFDLVDYITSNIMLPLGGLLIAVFIAYVWKFDKALVELKKGSDNLFNKYPWMVTLWQIFVKYFAPVSIFLVLLHSLGFLDFLGL